VNDVQLLSDAVRLTVDIHTQRKLDNSETREVFEILVHDAESDSSKAVGVMSGGQKVWINECLTRGVALYIAGNAGQPYETLFSDESDGPLDPDRKVQFMRMKREVLRQGGYQREFFISQTPELVAEAVVKAATVKSPKLRYPATKAARQLHFLRRFVPASAFDKSLRKQMKLPA